MNFSPKNPRLAHFLASTPTMSPHQLTAIQSILKDITQVGKYIHQLVNHSSITSIIGSHKTYNIGGDEQQKLDLIAHTKFIDVLNENSNVCAIISEEAEYAIDLNQNGNYIIALDPLDGSSNIDVHMPIGTIFSIYHRISPKGTPIQMEDILQQGTQQISTGYLLYSTITLLTFSIGKGTHLLFLDTSIDDFILAKKNIVIPKEGKIYTVNDAYFKEFSNKVKNYISYCHQQQYTARYIGTLVADFHRNLLKGGIYLYPDTNSLPDGKLRLMFEANPLAFLIEQAQGKASNNTQRILTIQPTALHQRTPLYIGSSSMVQKIHDGISENI